MQKFDSNKIIGTGITFDDVLLVPGFSDFKRQDISLQTQLTKGIKIQLPFISSPMDTVTESELAIALGKEGGIGIIHRNLTIQKQISEVEKVKKANILVGAAIGSSTESFDRAEALVKAKADVIVIDTAHGYTNTMLKLIKKLKTNFPKLQIIGGNIATYKGACALIEAGVDGLRVGMGPGAICTTRIISGMGIPQLTAIIEVAKAAKENKIPIIADGGIKYSGDIVKAFAAGASTVMMGSIFATCKESPGDRVELKRHDVPPKYKKILSKDQESYIFKVYRGMGSIAAMTDGTKAKSEVEFHGKSYGERTLVAEGVEGLVPVTGSVKSVIGQIVGGVKSGMYYVGAKTISELEKIGKFIQITQASLTESHPHDIVITNPGENYN